MESRRSNVNLSYLTLSPITSRLPIDESEDDNPEVPTPWSHRSSYIANKSAPTTPRILSRSPSQTRLGKASSTKLAGSKSYTNFQFVESALLTPGRSSGKAASVHARTLSGSTKKFKASTKLPAPSDDGEWLFRAGAAISSETRETKGQSWLVSRESSTSLVGQGDDDDDLNLSRHRPATSSARGSRAPSRMTSARTSRRGSRAGSKPDLSALATPLAFRTPGAGRTSQDGDYFSRSHDPAVLAGPDFLDEEDFEEDEESDVDDGEEERRQEEEVRKLTNEEAFGLGGMVERLLGWTFFDVKDDGFESDEEDTNTVKENERRSKQKPKGKQAVRVATVEPGVTTKEAPEEKHGWTDAAWLLSVASKALF